MTPLEQQVRDVLEAIPAHARLHNSRKPLGAILPAEQIANGHHKPRGLWYGIGDAWLKWCADEMPQWIGEHNYEIRLRRGAKILKLRTVPEIDAFTAKYEGEPAYPGAEPYPDWGRVAQKYDGIEIAPYQWRRRLELMWYYGWDCASGCIWNPRAIREVAAVRALRTFPPGAEK